MLLQTSNLPARLEYCGENIGKIGAPLVRLHPSKVFRSFCAELHVLQSYIVVNP